MAQLELVWARAAEVLVVSGPHPVAYEGCSLFLVVTGHGSGRFVVVTGSHHVGVGSAYAYSVFHLPTVGKLRYWYSYRVEIRTTSWRSPSKINFVVLRACTYFLEFVGCQGGLLPRQKKEKKKANDS